MYVWCPHNVVLTVIQSVQIKTSSIRHFWSCRFGTYTEVFMVLTMGWKSADVTLVETIGFNLVVRWGALSPWKILARPLPPWKTLELGIVPELYVYIVTCVAAIVVVDVGFWSDWACGDLFRRTWLLTIYIVKCIKKLFLVRGRVHSRVIHLITKTVPCPIANVVGVVRVTRYGPKRFFPDTQVTSGSH